MTSTYVIISFTKKIIINIFYSKCYIYCIIGQTYNKTSATLRCVAEILSYIYPLLPRDKLCNISNSPGKTKTSQLITIQQHALEDYMHTTIDLF